MFLSVTKVNDGYQFRNGPRRIVWAVTVRFSDGGEKKSALLHPSEVAEVIGYNTRHCRVTFDDQARLIVTNREV